MSGGTVEYLPEASRELEDALEWYLERSVQAAEAFAHEADRAVALIAAVFLSVFVILGAGCRSVPAAVPPPVAAMPTAVAPAPDPVLPHQTFTIDSKALGEIRRINVYTPPGYDEAAAARYPVLYMPDGGVEEDFPHVTTDIVGPRHRGEAGP